jgi:hypothetical protein
MNKELDDFLNNIRGKSTKNKQTEGFGIMKLAPSPVAQRPKYESFSKERPSDMYHTLSSGKQVAKYEHYIPGADNNELLAQRQSATEQIINGLGKAGNNLGATVLGNTAGFVYGLGAAASSGNFSTIFDNSFTQTIDDWNTKLNYKLPNYYTKQEKEAGFFGSLVENPANFIANDIMNGLSFTVGTIASEAIWGWATGGASIAARAGQWGAKIANATKYAKTAVIAGEEVGMLTRTAEQVGAFGKALLGAEKAAEGLAKTKGFVYQALDNAVATGRMGQKTANAFAKTGEVINSARFVATSSGNEASMEAFHFKKEAMENYYSNFEQIHGRQPTYEEVSEIQDKIEGASNKVFATNMAILGVSNLAMLGGMFNIKSPIGGIQASINKRLFGIGVEKAVGSEIFTPIVRKGWQKATGLTYKITSPIVREGLFEEGLQGVTTKTANNWIERQYDPKYLNKVMSLGDDAWKAMGEQYGTKEGWKEIGIGGIVGILGGFGTGEFSHFKDLAEEQEKVVAPNLNAMNVTLKTLVSDINANRYSSMAKILSADDKAEQAMQKGDAVAAKLAHNESMIALAEMHNDPIMNTDFKQLEKHASNLIDTTTVSEEEKTTLKEGFKTFIENYKAADNFADSIVGSQGRVYGTKFQAKNIKKALTYSMMQGESARDIMQSSLEEMKPYMDASLVEAVMRKNDLISLGREKSNKVKVLSNQFKDLENNSENIQKQITTEQMTTKEGRGTKLPLLERKLIEIEKEKQGVRTELEVIGREIAQHKKAQRTLGKDISGINAIDEFISVDDLLNIDEQLKEVETTHNTLKSLNPVGAKAIDDAISNYNKAKQALFLHNESIKLIANGEFKVRLANDNPFTSMYKKFSKSEEKADDVTSDFLTKLNDIRNGYTTSYMDVLQKVDIEKHTKRLEELNALETLTEEQQAQKVESEKMLENLAGKTITKEDIKDDTPTKKEDVKEKVLTVVEQLKVRIEEILKLFKTSFVGTQDVDEALKKKPSNKDIERYRELKQDKLIQDYELTGQLPIDTTLVEEFETLKERLSQWRVYDNLAEDEQSLADLLDIVAQLETEVEQQATLSEVHINDLFENREDFIGVGQQKEYSLSINTAFPATVHINKDTSVDITHQYATSVLSRMNAKNITVNGKPLAQDKIDSQKIGTVINFSSDGGDRKITIGTSGRIIMSQNDFKAIPNIRFLSASSWTYPILQEKNANGEWSPIKSDFTGDNIEGDSNDLVEGDMVELFVDVNNEFNKKLLKSKDENYQIDQVVIHIRKDGVTYGLVKALDRESSHPSILTLREEAYKNLIAGKSGVIATTNVKYVQVGNPSLSLDERGEEAQNRITDNALKIIEAVGYSLNGELVLNRPVKGEVRKTLLKKTSEKNKDKKIPIVIIKRGKQKIAFPISLVKTNVDKTEELHNAKTVVEINNVLIKNGISPKEFNLVEIDDEKIAEIEKRLAGNQAFISAEQLADNEYELRNLKEDATIALDLENYKVSLPSQKFNIDIESINYENLPAVKVEKQEVLEKLAEKEVETPEVVSAKKQVSKPKTSLKKEVVENSKLLSDTEEISQTTVDKIIEKKESIVQTNLIAFEAIDFSGKAVIYYKKGGKWGYLDANSNFESLVPIAQSKIEADYQAQKELEKAKKDIKC